MPKSPKPASNDLVTCPLCQGHGHLERTSVVTRLSDKEFNRTLQNYIDEVTYGSMQLRDDLPTGNETISVVREKDHDELVHRWSPKSELWRRSNKE